ncbi:nucleotide pyrophosphatase/phosphodiesterase-like [Iris pallida]|uniref:Purple acid phosphatase n=1 Tax=Iris pallida TaxID=29817 RepID=A0AAX6EKZ5_IRIPA|nr:nucleotide pyrophosphatase/phosphodiesterase-like [Iris pallida]
MAPSKLDRVLFVICFLCVSRSSRCSSPLLTGSADKFKGHTAISDFRLINRRFLIDCPDPNTYLEIHTDADSPLPDEANVTVTVSGVLVPDESDWIAMVSPSNSNVRDCILNGFYYLQTGDLSNLPLLCHYPVKAQYLSKDPSYLSCKKNECRTYEDGECVVRTCNASLTFHVVNIRTDIEFVFFTGGFATPCVLRRSVPISFANPSMPLYGHLSSIDSTGTSMRITWVSGDNASQLVQYGDGKSAQSQVTTFTKADMCSGILESPATDFGWHDPGYIHSAVMSGLQPSQSYTYRYGSDSVGWSGQVDFRTPPASGAKELLFLAYGDMGKAPLDQSVEHYIQPGSLSVIKAMENDVASGIVDSIFHIGDISYATGFLVEWDFFLNLITPLASRVSYMTAIGNHERDYEDSGSVYITPDSGGECGVPYETYFPMPTVSKDKPWYSIEQATVHFTVISTEHDWTKNSEQYDWIKKDLESVNRTVTPWIIFMGHRPMYSSHGGILPDVDPRFVYAIEPLLMKYKVDLAFFGHVHNYERTCAVYQRKCKGMPRKGRDGLDTYDNNNYAAPVHVVIGMAGFSLDDFPDIVADWSLSRITEFGYVRVQANKEQLLLQFVNSNTTKVEDSFRIIKGDSSRTL